MLVAKRDPYEFGTHDHSVPHVVTAPTSSRFTRTLNILQLVGALIAVPAGIGSAYTMYRANFSAEASCQALRVNIVAMLDRSVDASTRHMLVRRDVEAFERTCGMVDPDATAAFKVLLAADRVAPATAAVPRAEPHAVVRKAEPAPAVKPKQAAERTPAVAAAPAQSVTPESDAAWVAAVRTALLTREHERVAAAAPTPIVSPHLFSEWRTAPEAPAPQVAPALPPPATVATLAPPQADPDHPVPPAVIPETQPPARAHSRLGELVGEIPFVGKTLADRVSR